MLTYNPQLNSRYDIPAFLTQNNLTTCGAEIGTHLGEYAEYILNHWPGHLVCIDPYEEAPDYDKQIPYLWGEGDRISHYEQAMIRLKPFEDRCHFIRKPSHMAALDFQPATLDFIYIDGNHLFDFVLQDLICWWPKVKSGGYIFGHDFISNEWGRDIQRALHHFTLIYKVDIIIIPEGDLPWSYGIHKQ